MPKFAFYLTIAIMAILIRNKMREITLTATPVTTTAPGQTGFSFPPNAAVSSSQITSLANDELFLP
jgi:hypothetical protein